MPFCVHVCISGSCRTWCRTEAALVGQAVLMCVIVCERFGPSSWGVCGVLQTDGCTPLYIASENGHVEAVRALVRAGAAVNQSRVRDDCGGCCRSVSACVVWSRSQRASVRMLKALKVPSYALAS